MARHSNKSIAEILTPSLTDISFLGINDDNDNSLALLERKISLATEGFTTHKFCELVLKDRRRLSKENALTICDLYHSNEKGDKPKTKIQKIYYTVFVGVIKSSWNRKEVHRYDKR
jgi:hypothetical protein